jgi:hypothetical protein
MYVRRSDLSKANPFIPPGPCEKAAQAGEFRRLGLDRGEALMKNLFVSTILFLSITTAAHAANCYKAMIKEPQPFLGNGGEIVVLSDGGIWKNMSYLYLYLYEYYPTVIICPGKGKMILKDSVFDIVQVR